MKRKAIIGFIAAILTMTGCSQQTNKENENSNAPVSSTSSTRSVSEEETTEEKETVPVTEDITEAAETAEEEYKQSYPVQDYQKKYAEFINSLKTEYSNGIELYTLHIDSDTTPELVVVHLGSSATVYSFDGTEVYEVGDIHTDSHTYDFSYRPYLGMTSCDIGSVMYGNSHTIVQTFVNEEGRLKVDETIHLTEPENDENSSDYKYVTGFEDTIIYDMGFTTDDVLGESWKTPDAYNRITDSTIEYWLNN